MKKYIVIRQYLDGISCASIEFTTDIKADAVAYADIKQRNRSDEAYTYKVAEIC